MELVTKPDFDEARRRWQAFWNREIVGRPCTSVIAPRDDASAMRAPAYMAETRENPRAVAERHCRYSESRFWGGEAIPMRDASFGPDMFAGFLGAAIQHAEDEATSWSVPFVERWEEALPLRLVPTNALWRKLLETTATFAEVGEGFFLTAMIDLHSNMDALSGIRGPERLMLDVMDCPALIDRAMEQVRAFYQPVYEGCYEAARMKEWGSVGTLPYYCEGRFATVQSDVIIMLSPEHFRRWALPALEEETAFLDHSVMHYDGPGALRHLDDVLAIPTLDGIQWTPGDGHPPVHEWLDLLKRIQASGKSTYVPAPMEAIKAIHRELRPELTFYSTWASSEKEACEFLKWLEDHT